MFTFRFNYFILTIVLLVTEIAIAIFVHDDFGRPYLGDVLVVMLMYCFFKSFVNIAVKKLLVFVLLFAFTIELLQYFKFVKLLGLQHSTFANVVLGNSFAWNDMLAYTAGILIVLFLESYLGTKTHDA